MRSRLPQFSIWAGCGDFATQFTAYLRMILSEDRLPLSGITRWIPA